MNGFMWIVWLNVENWRIAICLACINAPSVKNNILSHIRFKIVETRDPDYAL